MAKQGTEVNSNIFYLATWIIGGSTKIHKEKAIVQSFNGIYFNENFTSYLLKALAVNSCIIKALKTKCFKVFS